MKPKKIWVNLAVSDIARTTRFYQALGFVPNGKNSVTETITSFLAGNNELVMHFFVKETLRDFLGGDLTDPHQANEIIFTLSADSMAEVNEWAGEIEQAGGTLVTRPSAFGDGYYGFIFADPDGHQFNVFYM